MKSTDRFHVPNVTCFFDGAATPVHNLSVGGFFVATKQPPLAGPVVELTLTLAGRPPFPIHGKVSWINTAESPRAPELPMGFGVKIVQIALPDKIALLDAIKRARGEGRQRG